MVWPVPVPTAPSDRGPAARREVIRRRVLDEGYVGVEELARSLGVSLMTMHRDLDALASDGWLTKIRGGATANPSALVDAGVRERSAAMRAEKQAVAALAAEMVRHGQTLFLDDSTTVLEMAPHLVGQPALTVATNFLPAISALGDSQSIQVHLLGGHYLPRQESCNGLGTVQAIERLQADLFFMSTTAVTGGKCLHRSEPTVMVREAFMRCSARRVLLVDHAKFGRPAAHVLCDVAEFDTVIVDDGVDPDDLADLRERCDDVRVAAVRGGPF
jgi:DeoR/GlpR family transcriptional regulator of sugar metabolism